MHKRISVFMMCLLAIPGLVTPSPKKAGFESPRGPGASGLASPEVSSGSHSGAARPAHAALNPRGPGARGKVARGTSAMVASADSIASAVGLGILQAGGNAIDAAVAVAFALAVTFPNAGNMGGGGFMLIRMSGGESIFINYREKAPAGASRDMYLDAQGNVVDGLSTKGHLAAGVPGTVAGLALAHRLYGKLPWSELLAPACGLARDGFPVRPSLVRRIRAKEKLLGSFKGSREKFIKPRLKAGDFLVQPDLARTLERIMLRGEDDFYRGKTAELIVKEMKDGGGLITMEDLAAYRAVAGEPVRFAYRGFEVLSAPLPSSGGMILYLLAKMLEPESAGPFHSAEAVHLVSEAEKIVFRLRALYMGDEDYYAVPKGALLSPAFVEKLRKLMDPSKVLKIEELEGFELLPERTKSPRGRTGGDSGSMEGGEGEWRFMERAGITAFGTWGESEETTHYSVVDEYGNAVANTYTLNSSFGSGVTVEGAGFLLNNEMDDFSIKPGFPNMYGLMGSEANAIEPGKRMLSSMSPTIIAKDNKLFMVLGTPGGATIPTTLFQVVRNVIDLGMSLEEAVAAGRFHEQYLPDGIYVEEGALERDVEEQLLRMGHRILRRNSIGDVQAIVVEDGRLTGVSDPRGSGKPMGY